MASSAAGRIGDRRCFPWLHVEQTRHDLAQRGQPYGIGCADDSSQDYLKGDVGGAGSNGKALPDRPFGDVCGSDLGHLGDLARYGIAMERGHQQSPLMVMFVLIKDK